MRLWRWLWWTCKLVSTSWCYLSLMKMSISEMLWWFIPHVASVVWNVALKILLIYSAHCMICLFDVIIFISFWSLNISPPARPMRHESVTWMSVDYDRYEIGQYNIWSTFSANISIGTCNYCLFSLLLFLAHISKIDYMFVQIAMT